MKPRLRFLSGKYGGYWVCVHYGMAGRGETPKAAYRDVFRKFREITQQEHWAWP